MKLEDQVCTLSQGKQLKQLGINKKSLFYHIDNLVIGYEGIKLRNSLSSIKNGIPVDAGVIKYYNAFTVSELGLLNRDDIRTYKTDGYWCAYIPVEGIMKYFGESFNTEAELRAEILIMELINNIITPEECNSRLTE